MLDEGLEAALLFVTLLYSVDVLDEDGSLSEFRVTLLLTITLTPLLELVCVLSHAPDANKYNKLKVS